MRWPLLIFLFFTFACQKQKSLLELALDHAEKNSKEIKKALSHYKKHDIDSLKYGAARFLIENMVGRYHYEISPNDDWNLIVGASDSIISKGIDLEEYKNIMDSFVSTKPLKFEYKKDLNTIKSEDLISNIELAFKVWPKPWNDYLDFDGFCRYILPYKSGNEDFNIGYRGKYYEKNNYALSESSSTDIAKEIIEFPKSFRYYRPLPIEQSADDIEKGRMADCVDFSNLAATRARAIGLPLVIDFAIWPSGRGTHYWNSLVYNKDSLIYADRNFFWGTPGNYNFLRKVAKVYRKGAVILDLSIVNLDTVPKTAQYLYDTRIIDVTEQYVRTVSASIPLSLKEHKFGSTAYLCVFNNLTWKPIAYSKVAEGNRISFHHLGPDNIYTVFLAEGKKMVPVSQAFTVNDQDGMVLFEPSETKRHNVRLKRKTKLLNRVKNYASSLIGSTIEVSDTSDFNPSKILFTITDTILIPTQQHINISRKYRYARLLQKSGKPMEVAEFRFLSGKESPSHKNVVMDSKDHDKAQKLNDGDNLSYYSADVDENGSSSIVFDFGSKLVLTAFELAPKSDVNYIEPGNLYELFYWDVGWVSMGTRIASDYNINFEDVPQNAVLWLRNLSKGQEEELFLYKNGKQLFWNSTDY